MISSATNADRVEKMNFPFILFKDKRLLDNSDIIPPERLIQQGVL